MSKTGKREKAFRRYSEVNFHFLFLLKEVIVDWRQRRTEVEKYCEAQRLNSSQHQKLPLAIF